ncbi:ankyrin repeat-containing domain protein [Ilyonectria sp. MPI-CAGE-AT-0026]|nr:ankyrin repeat-containing domain protein [Ilyonectria sp. MPI-CAGE-AT-0026]
MAEVVAVVASGAGLASLALQLAEGVKRLRQRHRNAAGLLGDISTLVEDLDLITKQLNGLEADTHDILEQQMGPIILERCRRRSEILTERLTKLTANIPTGPSKMNAVRAVVQSKRLYLIHQNIAMKKLLRIADPENSDGDSSRNPVTPTSERHDDVLPRISNIPRHRFSHCAVRSCHCSCHITRSVGGRFWRLQYTPFANIFNTCDNARCSAQRYRVNLRAALSHFGVRWAVVFGLDMMVEPGKYWLQPVLQVERVVNRTAPGFVILMKLSENLLKWNEAEIQFRELYRSDPAFVNQVDPQGRGYLEGVDSPSLMYNCASFSSTNRHLEIIEAVTSLGCDFSTTVSPSFESWPEPCVHDPELARFVRMIPEDPFYLEYMGIILKSNPDFGDSPPIHNAILHGSKEDFRVIIQKTQPLEENVNFLGQSPLHISVRYPERLNILLAAGHDASVRDKNGITPLMYAAAMNISEAVTTLINHGADLFMRDKLNDYDFIMYAAVRHHWSLVWCAIDLISSNDRSLLPRLFPSIFLASGRDCFLAHDPESLTEGWKKYWLKVFSKVTSLDICFEDGGTLMHVVDSRLLANMLVNSGFAKFNHRNNLGEHSLFAIARFLDPVLFRQFIAKGALVNITNNQGQTVLHGLLGLLHDPENRKKKELLEILDILLDSGAKIGIRDHCSCNCSPSGCLPGSSLEFDLVEILHTQVYNGFWVFEWLLILEERGLLVEAKDFALSVFRQTYYKEAGFRHTCCRSNSTDEHDDTEEEFWDIGKQIQWEDLRDKMNDWAEREYQEVKHGLMVHLQQRQSAKKREMESEKQNQSGRRHETSASYYRR